MPYLRTTHHCPKCGAGTFLVPEAAPPRTFRASLLMRIDPRKETVMDTKHTHGPDAKREDYSVSISYNEHGVPTATLSANGLQTSITPAPPETLAFANFVNSLR